MGFSAELRFIFYGPSYAHCCRTLTFAPARLSCINCNQFTAQWARQTVLVINTLSIVDLYAGGDCPVAYTAWQPVIRQWELLNVERAIIPIVVYMTGWNISISFVQFELGDVKRNRSLHRPSMLTHFRRSHRAMHIFHKWVWPIRYAIYQSLSRTCEISLF